MRCMQKMAANVEFLGYEISEKQIDVGDSQRSLLMGEYNLTLICELTVCCGGENVTGKIGPRLTHDTGWRLIWKRLKNDRLLYLMILPALIWYIMFCYVPMGGMVLAFKTYRYDMGVLGSPWCGLENFKMMFTDKDSLAAIRNTFIISFGKLLIGFPFPIIVAVLLNELRNGRTKKFFQTVFTFPHFISWVVLSSIFINLFSNYGLVNQLLQQFDLPTISPLIDPKLFRPFLWLSATWKEFGWDAIIYLAALAGIDQQLYEAADIDGATRWQKMRHITWPGIRSVVCIMLILQVGNIMNGASFNQVFNLYSAPVYGVGDILDTFVQRYTFKKGANFGYTTAVSLFKSLVGVVMITLANKTVTRAGEQGLF